MGKLLMDLCSRCAHCSRVKVSKFHDPPFCKLKKTTERSNKKEVSNLAQGVIFLHLLFLVIL